MIATALGVVIVGIALAVAIGVRRGIDAVALVILAFIVAMGAFTVSVARRTKRGSVAPVRCPECGGLNSPHAPYCTHCGARLQQ